MSLIITGIGSRSYDLDTPSTNREIIEWMGVMAGVYGWILRSGGADGMDSAFETVWHGPKEIFIPWGNFNGRSHGINGSVEITNPALLSQAASMAQKIHPAWNRLGRGAKALHSRNANQICGETLSVPSSICVFCADVDGKGEVKGGTRTAVMLAIANNIPTFNLKHTQDRLDLKDFLNEWIEHIGSNLLTSGEGRPVSSVIF